MSGWIGLNLGVGIVRGFTGGFLGVLPIMMLTRCLPAMSAAA